MGSMSSSGVAPWPLGVCGLLVLPSTDLACTVGVWLGATCGPNRDVGMCESQCKSPVGVPPCTHQLKHRPFGYLGPGRNTTLAASGKSLRRQSPALAARAGRCLTRVAFVCAGFAPASGGAAGGHLPTPRCPMRSLRMCELFTQRF